MKTSDSLKMILRNTYNRYNELAEASRQKVLSELAPEAKAPASGKLHTDLSKDMMKSYAESSRKEALNLIDGEIVKVNKAVAAAPSTEAINRLTALSLSKSKDVRDYEAIYSVYGSNAGVAKALASIAKDNDVNFYAPTPEYDRLEALQNCRQTFNTVLDPDRIVGGGMSAGSVAFIEMGIDGVD